MPGLQTQKELLKDLTPEEKKHLNSHIGRGDPNAPNSAAKQDSNKFMVNKRGVHLTVEKEESTKKDTLFFKDCSDSTFKIQSRSAKILIESCHNCTFFFHGVIMTNVIEIWKSNGVHLNIHCKASTIQVDICQNLEITYDKKDLFYQVIWSDVDRLSLAFNHADQKKHNIVTGYDKMVEQIKYEDPGMVLNRVVDQFIIRFVEEAIRCEQMVRLPGGFPTTEREASEFDEKKKKNDKILEKHLRKAIRTTEVKHGKETSNIAAEKKPYIITNIQDGDNLTIPLRGDRVLCHYTGRLAGGAEFDSTVGKEPFEFVVGVGHVIQGWDLALQELSKGQKAKIWIAADYGYGAQGVKDYEKMKAAGPDSPNLFVIPPNSDLEFEVELVDVIHRETKPAAAPVLDEKQKEEIDSSFLPENLQGQKKKPAKKKAPGRKK